MAKQAERNEAAEGARARKNVEAKVRTKVKRWRVHPDGVELLSADGTWVLIERAKMPDADQAHVFAYGLGQKYSSDMWAINRAAGESDPTAAECAEYFAGCYDGSLFARTRGGGGLTLERFTAKLYDTAFRQKNGRAPTTEEVKSGVAKWLDPDAPTRAKLVAKYEAAMSIDFDL